MSPVLNPVGVDGAPGSNPRGAWSPVSTYGYRDMVVRRTGTSGAAGGTFMALTNGLNTDPLVDTTNWLQIAADGAVGATGPGGGVNLWRRDISPFTGFTPIQGTFTSAAASGALFGQLTNNAGVQNDGLSYSFGMEAGTWTLSLLIAAFTNRGIATVTLDGTSVGTLDFYAATATTNKLLQLAGINVPTTGQHTLGFQALTKNASATAYVLCFEWITLVRTA